VRINGILERASGYSCGEGRRQSDGGDGALEFHGLATLPLVMLAS
jgi:hypothetical protein